MLANFHLSLPCKDLKKTEEFYSNILETKVGRSANNWIDLNLFGNQITFTKSGDFNFSFKNYRLGEQILPSFHFGIIVTLNLAIGQQTPPVASVLVTACSVAKADIWEVSKINVMFVAVLFAVLLLVTYVPFVPMGLVEHFYR